MVDLSIVMRSRLPEGSFWGFSGHQVDYQRVLLAQTRTQTIGTWLPKQPGLSNSDCTGPTAPNGAPIEDPIEDPNVTYTEDTHPETTFSIVFMDWSWNIIQTEESLREVEWTFNCWMSMSVQGFPRAFPSPNLLIFSPNRRSRCGMGDVFNASANCPKDVWSGLDPGVWLSKSVKCLIALKPPFVPMAYFCIAYMYPVFLQRWIISEYVSTLVPLAGRWTVIVGGAAKLSPNMSEGLNRHVCDFGWLEDLFTRLFDGSSMFQHLLMVHSQVSMVFFHVKHHHVPSI